MFKVAFKSFRHCFREYIVCFASIAFSIAMLFSCIYISMIVSNITFYEIFVHTRVSSIGVFLEKLIPVVVVLSAAVIIYALRFYIQTRAKDYSLYLILGIRKKQFIKVLVAEYICGWIISTAVGLLFGNVIVLFVKRVLMRFQAVAAVADISVGKIYKVTLGGSFALLACILIILLVMVSEKDLSALMKAERVSQNKKPASWWPYMVFLGLFLSAVSVVLNYTAKGLFPIGLLIILFLSGIFLILSFGMGLFLQKLKKGRKYYQKLIGRNTLYYRFSNNRNMIFMQIMIGVSVLFLGYTVVSGSLPIHQPGVHPVDFMVMAEEEDQEFLKEWDAKYEMFIPLKEYNDVVKNELVSLSADGGFPYIWSLTTGEGSDCFGISLSDYNRIWGKTEVLEDNEVISILDSEEFPSMKGKDGKTSELILGAMKLDGMDPERDKKYTVKEEIVQPVFGFDVAGLVVFSDHVFQTARENDDFHGFMELKNVSEEDYDKALAELEAYSKTGKQFQIFDRKTAVAQEESQRLLNLTVIGFIIVMMLAYSYFVLYLKLYSEREYLCEKYDYLRVAGMHRRERKGLLKSEIRNFMVPAVILSVISGIIFNSTALVQAVQNAEGTAKVYAAMILISCIAVYGIVQIVFLCLLTGQTVKAVIETC